MKKNECRKSRASVPLRDNEAKNELCMQITVHQENFKKSKQYGLPKVQFLTAGSDFFIPYIGTNNHQNSINLKSLLGMCYILKKRVKKSRWTVPVKRIHKNNCNKTLRNQ